MNEFSDCLKSIIPILTFFLGILAIPLIEHMKSTVKAKSVRNNLFLEINDDLNELPKRFEKMSETLISLKAIKEKKSEEIKNIKYVPKITVLFFLKPAIEYSFYIFNADQRNALKTLSIQLNTIEKYLQEIANTEVSEDTIDESIKNCKRYLHTGICMMNTMRIISNNSKANKKGVDKEVIAAILLEIGVKLKVDDLRISSTVNFK